MEEQRHARVRPARAEVAKWSGVVWIQSCVSSGNRGGREEGEGDCESY